MEQANHQNPLLDMMERPAFYVRDGVVVQANHPAKQRLINVGDKIDGILGIDMDAYNAYTGGYLYLTVRTADTPCGCTVTRTEDGDLFTLDLESDYTHMQALALAAQKLATPLSDAMNLADSLQASTRTAKQAAQIRRALYQLQRIICNMSDLPRYDHRISYTPEAMDLNAVFSEIMEKIGAALDHTKYQLHYTGLMQIVMGYADREMLERAVSNLISNAIKFSPENSTITAKLTRNGNTLSFTVTDEGAGVMSSVPANLFQRYLREPSIEDGRHGIGLGLSLIRAVAANHGGTLLIDQPEGKGTRATMTMSIEQNEQNSFHTPILLPTSDYAGGWDHALLELSEVLDANAYKK